MSESFTKQIHRHIASAVRTVGAMLLVAALDAVAMADVSLDLSLGRERAYPGEAVPVTVTLRVSDATVRNIAYPRLTAPASGPVSFAPPVQVDDATDPNVALYRFTGQISGVKPGQLTVGPASLDLEIMEAASGSAAFFGAVEPRPLSLVAAPAALTVLSLPSAGRPASFNGAIGMFILNVTTTPEKLTVDTPFTITTTISGTGNLDGASCPQVTGDDLRSYQPTVNRQRNRLICEQVVVPTAAGPLPPVVWNFFDPQQRLYRTARHQLPVVAASSRQLRNDTSPVVTATLPPSATPPTTHGIPILLWLLASLVLVATAYSVRVLRRRRQITYPPEPPVSTPPQLARLMAAAEQALADGDVEKFYTLLFRAIQEIIAYNHVSPACSVSSLPCHKSPSAATKLARPLANCDQVRYGKINLSHEQMTGDLNLVHGIIAGIHS